MLIECSSTKALLQHCQGSIDTLGSPEADGGFCEVRDGQYPFARMWPSLYQDGISDIHMTG